MTYPKIISYLKLDPLQWRHFLAHSQTYFFNLLKTVVPEGKKVFGVIKRKKK